MGWTVTRPGVKKEQQQHPHPTGDQHHEGGPPEKPRKTTAKKVTSTLKHIAIALFDSSPTSVLQESTSVGTSTSSKKSGFARASVSSNGSNEDAQSSQLSALIVSGGSKAQVSTTSRASSIGNVSSRSAGHSSRTSSFGESSGLVRAWEDDHEGSMNSRDFGSGIAPAAVGQLQEEVKALRRMFVKQEEEAEKLRHEVHHLRLTSRPQSPTRNQNRAQSQWEDPISHVNQRSDQMHYGSRVQQSSKQSRDRANRDPMNQHHGLPLGNKPPSPGYQSRDSSHPINISQSHHSHSQWEEAASHGSAPAAASFHLRMPSRPQSPRGNPNRGYNRWDDPIAEGHTNEDAQWNPHSDLGSAIALTPSSTLSLEDQLRSMAASDVLRLPANGRMSARQALILARKIWGLPEDPYKSVVSSEPLGGMFPSENHHDNVIKEVHNVDPDDNYSSNHGGDMVALYSSDMDRLQVVEEIVHAEDSFHRQSKGTPAPNTHQYSDHSSDDLKFVQSGSKQMPLSSPHLSNNGYDAPSDAESEFSFVPKSRGHRSSKNKVQQLQGEKKVESRSASPLRYERDSIPEDMPTLHKRNSESPSPRSWTAPISSMPVDEVDVDPGLEGLNLVDKRYQELEAKLIKSRQRRETLLSAQNSTGQLPPRSRKNVEVNTRDHSDHLQRSRTQVEPGHGHSHSHGGHQNSQTQSHGQDHPHLFHVHSRSSSPTPGTYGHHSRKNSLAAAADMFTRFTPEEPAATQSKSSVIRPSFFGNRRTVGGESLANQQQQQQQHQQSRAFPDANSHQLNMSKVLPAKVSRIPRVPGSNHVTTHNVAVQQRTSEAHPSSRGTHDDHGGLEHGGPDDDADFFTLPSTQMEHSSFQSAWNENRSFGLNADDAAAGENHLVNGNLSPNSSIVRSMVAKFDSREESVTPGGGATPIKGLSPIDSPIKGLSPIDSPPTSPRVISLTHESFEDIHKMSRSPSSNRYVVDALPPPPPTTAVNEKNRLMDISPVLWQMIQ